MPRAPTPCWRSAVPDWQGAFADALLDPERPVPPGLVRPDGLPAGRRFDIYRNNVVVALIEALGEAFPVVRAVVGEEFFDAMAGAYVRAHPPSSPRMMFYGDGFAPFLASFPPAAGLPYLPDVARLEYARRLAYHAADDPVADPSVLGGLDASALMEARLALRAACHVLRSAHPVHAIWRFNATEDKSPVRPAAEDVLVSRPDESVLVQLLPPGGAAFLLALQAGEPLGRAAERAAADAPAFDLGANLASVFSARIVTTISIQQD